MLPPDPAGVFAAVAATLYAAHALADHWVQTDLQARDKSIPGRIGRLACARHVAGYHLTAAAMLAIAAATLGLALRPGWVAAGLAVSAVTHYFADRRAPLARLARLARVDGFHRLAGGGLNGAYLLDQSFHHAWLWVAALVIAAGSAR